MKYMKLWQAVETYRREHPLAFVLWCALAVRMLAVFFAKGFLMHDDHFLTVEPASSWAAGANFNNWMPGIGNDRVEPEPISFFYLGFLYLIFKTLNVVGIEHPDTQMYFMRLVHALYSLITVALVYKITLRLSDRSRAFLAGMLMALLGILPNFSVRNLVELVCMPPLLYGMWLLIDRSSYSLTGKVRNIHWKHLAAAAFVMGLAVGIRYQTGLFVALTGLVLLLHNGFRSLVLFGSVSFAAFFLTQIDDVLLWGGKPFQHLLGYFGYNTKNAFNYPGSPFAYLSFIGFFILPPVSLMLVFGFFHQWRKHLLVVLPVVGFVLFHLVYPNKQERFILPILPFVVSIGTIGWGQWVQQSAFWQKRSTLHRRAWRFFWVINTLAMVVLCFVYSKKSRVEAMLYLHNSGNCRNFIQEITAWEGGTQVPQYYWGSWSGYYVFDAKTDVRGMISDFPANEARQRYHISTRPIPNYVVFYNRKNIDERVAKMKSHFPKMEYCTTISPGWFEELLFRMNPLNAREEMFIYYIPDSPNAGQQ